LLYIIYPELNGPRKTNNLTSNIYLTLKIFGFVKLRKNFDYKLEGNNLIDLLEDQSVAISDYVYCAQEWPWYIGEKKSTLYKLMFF